MVIDVVELPTAESAEVVGSAIMQLPLIPTPIMGEAVDGFLLKVLVSDGRYSRLFGAIDEIEGGEVVLKFPKPQVAAVATYHAAFVREAWVGARVNSPWIGRIIELPPGRQTCLYTVMPLYQGELLSTRLARRPAVGLEEGRNIAIKLARGASALHRAGIIHRDIKPDNVILESGGSLKLIDLGVVRVPGLEDFPAEDIPGTSAIWRRKYWPANRRRGDWLYSLGVASSAPSPQLFPSAISMPSVPGRTTDTAERAAPEPAPGCGGLGARRRHRSRSAAFHDMNSSPSRWSKRPVRAPLALRRPLRSMSARRWRCEQGVSALLAVRMPAAARYGCGGTTHPVWNMEIKRAETVFSAATHRHVIAVLVNTSRRRNPATSSP